MTDAEVTFTLTQLLDQTGPLRFDLPVPLEDIDTVSIRATPDNKLFLKFTFPDSTPRSVGGFFESTREDPATINEPTDSTVLMRPWLTGEFYLQLIFGDYAPRGVLTRCTPAGATDSVMLTSTAIGTAASEIEIAFLALDMGGSIRYLDPAIIIRILAIFSAPYEELLFRAIQQDLWDSFGLARVFAFYDGLHGNLKLLLREALRLEFEGRMSLGIPTETLPYRMRLGPSSNAITRADLVLDYHLAVESNPDKFAAFDLTDLRLHFSVFRADQYEMDLIDIRSPRVRFSHLLLGNHQHKIIVNGPVFDLFSCGKAPDLIRGARYVVTWEAAFRGFDIPGLTKGTLVFRPSGTLLSNNEMGDCPIPNDPTAWRYHFGQSLSGDYGLHLDPIPANHNFACAVEPVIGVFRDGLRIGDGHEIDTLGSDQRPRAEPDRVYARGPSKAGIPILGRCRRNEVDYLFVLVRPDSYRDLPNMASWEDMIDLLRAVGVTDAFVTDGDDSVGLIIDNELVFQPGLKKDAPMPLAIGFRKVLQP
jgi:hypothetical protein